MCIVNDLLYHQVLYLRITPQAHVHVQWFNSGVLCLERFTSPKSHLPKRLEAIAWMQRYFNSIGDHMPDRMAVQLPSLLTQILNEENVNDSILPQHFVAAHQKKVGKHPKVSSHFLLNIYVHVYSKIFENMKTKLLCFTQCRATCPAGLHQEV